MAKDPAFLFYPGDWQGGTMTFTRFLKGCYMDILIAQFNSGHLSLEEIKTVLGSDFGQGWPAIQKKFKKDDDGLFFNEKMETEMIKRKEYSKSRAENRKKKDMKHICKTHDPTYVPHMENENENEDELKNKKEIRIDPRETIDEKISAALDEIYIDKQRMNWKYIDFDLELFSFIEKVRGAPDDYINRDTGGIRNAFIYQLKNAKKKTDGKHKNDRTQQNLNDLAIILNHAAGGS